jgi:hypothetical protein
MNAFFVVVTSLFSCLTRLTCPWVPHHAIFAFLAYLLLFMYV